MKIRIEMVREYYGDDIDIMPNDHCFWDDMTFLIGWKETGEHFRERILNDSI